MNDEMHISTKDRPGDYDAIETAKPGEPLFPLQGGDPFAPATIQFWAAKAREEANRIMSGCRAGFEPTDERHEYQPTAQDEADARKLLRKATQAEEVSWAFQAYQRNDVEPTGGRATYNDLPAFETTAEQDAEMDERKARIFMAGQLTQSFCLASEVAETLARRRILTTADMKIREAVEQLREAAMEIEPRRGRERT